jgi:hypothetical protein
MPTIKTYPLQSSAILRLNSERELINVEPWYQRRGDVWTLEKKQLLIDSILNEYDLPKLYFHALSKKDKEKFDYAIIDGRQRLETIWQYMDDGFSLDDDFVYLGDRDVKAGGLYYSQLASKYPRLKIRFDSFSVPIVCVETEEIDLIEDMFSRLNEAVPLSAAEKRNAIGGPMAECIRDLAEHAFFTSCVLFGNKRYQHREVVARLLFIEFSLHFSNKLIDTKKPYLDDMVRKYRSGEAGDLMRLREVVSTVLGVLTKVFVAGDFLLRSQGNIPVYYLLAQQALKSKQLSKVTREKITEFDLKLAENREIAAVDIAKSDFDLLEYDRMSQQGTNDAPSIRERLRIICAYLGVKPPLIA